MRLMETDAAQPGRASDSRVSDTLPGWVARLGQSTRDRIRAFLIFESWQMWDLEILPQSRYGSASSYSKALEPQTAFVQTRMDWNCLLSPAFYLYLSCFQQALKCQFFGKDGVHVTCGACSILYAKKLRAPLMIAADIVTNIRWSATLSSWPLTTSFSQALPSRPEASIQNVSLIAYTMTHLPVAI